MELEKFDIEKAKAGRKVVTRSGLPVEILKWDAEMGNSKIVGIIHCKLQFLCTWGSDGTYFGFCENERDIFLAPEERYVNEFPGGFSIKIFNSAEEAKKSDSLEEGYLGTYKLVKV